MSPESTRNHRSRAIGRSNGLHSHGAGTLFCVLALLFVLTGYKLGAQSGGTVNFGNKSSSLVTNGLTASPVLLAENIQVALYWSPLGLNQYVAIGVPTSVGALRPGLFWGGIVTTGPETLGGESAEFQVRAWGGGYATYEEAVQVEGVLIGLSSVITLPTGDPDGLPPLPPVSLALNGLEGFVLMPNPPVPPVLNISVTGTNELEVTISWEPSAPGWELESNVTLDPAGWEPAPSGTNNPAAVIATWPKKFYRLKKL